MAKLKIDTKLKDEKGNIIGEKITCLVLNQSNEFTKKADGSPLVVEVADKKSERTLKSVICESLLHEDPKSPLSGAEKSERYKLWLLVNNTKKSIELKTEEIAKIKECILNIQPILIAGQCELLIEGK